MKGATSIQERLWELRKDKGLNLEELSELTGISKSALGSYEKEDYKEINHGNLITLADFYGVSVDYLQCHHLIVQMQLRQWRVDLLPVLYPAQ